jgi:phosphoglycolate phosphatase
VGVLWGFREKDELMENGAQILLSKPSELLEKVDFVKNGR